MPSALPSAHVSKTLDQIRRRKGRKGRARKDAKESKNDADEKRGISRGVFCGCQEWAPLIGILGRPPSIKIRRPSIFMAFLCDLSCPSFASFASFASTPLA